MSYAFDVMTRIWEEEISGMIDDELAMRFGLLIEEIHSANHNVPSPDGTFKGDGINKDPKVSAAAKKLDKAYEELKRRESNDPRIEVVRPFEWVNGPKWALRFGLLKLHYERKNGDTFSQNEVQHPTKCPICKGALVVRYGGSLERIYKVPKNGKFLATMEFDERHDVFWESPHYSCQENCEFTFVAKDTEGWREGKITENDE